MTKEITDDEMDNDLYAGFDKDFEDLQTQVISLMAVNSLLVKALLKKNKQDNSFTQKQVNFLIETLFTFESYIKHLQKK